MMSGEHRLLVDDDGGFSPRQFFTKRTKVLLGLLVIVAIACAVVIPLVLLKKKPTEDSGGEALFARNGVVAADNSVCSDIGKQLLEAGGHAVDAAVGTAFCQGVLNPFASGIGGGGIMLVYINDGNATNTNFAFDFIDMREVAPAAATKDMYYSNPSESITGPRAIAVPGEVKGLHAAWSKYGRLPWADLATPAAKLAENFTVGPLLARFIQSSSADILSIPGLTEVYAPNGKLLLGGEFCQNPKLAQTLRIIAEQGPDAMYNGDIGKNMAQDVQDAGGILTFEDLQNYTVLHRQPISSYFMGYKMVLPPAPYGGPVIAMVLNILERYNLAQTGYGLESLQWIVESLKFGFSDRMALGDPDFVDLSDIVPVMLDKDHASVLRQRINQSMTHPPAYYIDLTDDIRNFTDHGTTHISVVDKDRNAVSFTTTVNYNFGSKFVSKSTGILMNDEMDDFTVSNSSNVWGLPPSSSNLIVPGKRPLSSMSPSMVFRDNKLYLVAGANGGPRIITSTLQTYLNVLSFGRDLYTAVTFPRIHTQFTPPVLYYESKLSESLVEGMEHKGNTMVLNDYTTAVQAVMVQEDNTLLAVSDFRKMGQPAGY